MSYESGERDMVLLEHRIEAIGSSIEGGLERAISTLVVYGEPFPSRLNTNSGDVEPWRLPQSAMSKTVGYPAAIAANLILGRVKNLLKN